MGRPKKEGVKATQMKLPESTRRLAALVGEGDRTAGVERLFAQLPVFYRVKLLLELMSSDPSIPAHYRALVESELQSLEGLEIDRVYDEAVAEGVIVVKGANGETAWIA